MKNIDVGTLLAFLFLLFRWRPMYCVILCVVFLALVHLQVCMCAYGRIDHFSCVIILPDAASSVILGGRHQSSAKDFKALLEPPQHRRRRKGQYAAACRQAAQWSGHLFKHL